MKKGWYFRCSNCDKETFVSRSYWAARLLHRLVGWYDFALIWYKGGRQ